MDSFWQNLPEKEDKAIRKELSKRAKKLWKEMDSKDKKVSLDKMRVAAKEVGNGGSKAENKIADLLRENSFAVEQRSHSVIYPYEVDILLPNERFAIEVDGPTHFSEEIYGEENLANVQRRDQVKNSFILGRKINLIRCQDKTNSYSLSACSRTVDKIVEIVKCKKKGSVELFVIDIR